VADHVELKPGDKVKLQDANRWWDVRTGDERFVVLTRQQSFRTKGTLLYTVIDWERGVRGPCNLIGGGWDEHMEDEACEALLRALNAHVEWDAFMRRDHAENGTTSWRHPDEVMVEVSHRNYVPIDILTVKVGHPTPDPTPERHIIPNIDSRTSGDESE